MKDLFIEASKQVFLAAIERAEFDITIELMLIATLEKILLRDGNEMTERQQRGIKGYIDTCEKGIKHSEAEKVAAGLALSLAKIVNKDE